MTRIRKLLSETRGVGAIEYALVASLISIAAIVGYSQLGAKVQTHFANLSNDITYHL